MKAASTQAPAGNPLVPDAVLRATYARMVEARLLEQHLRGSRRRGLPSIQGEEACRAAAAQCMKPGDLVSDLSRSAAADLMLGVSLRAILRSLHEQRGAGSSVAPLAAHRLPREDGIREQLATALGSAHALRAARTQQVLFVLCAAASDSSLWKHVLGQAGSRELPIVFLVLPSAGEGTMLQGTLSDRARGWGVPGIPVDMADGVALYRVLSEATLRARGGDGPTLVEGVRWQLPGRSGMRSADPLDAMALSLLARRVASTHWQASVADRFRRRLQALDPGSAGR